MKRNEILIYSKMYMNLEHIMLNEEKTDMKGHVLHDPICVKRPGQANLERQKVY